MKTLCGTIAKMRKHGETYSFFIAKLEAREPLADTVPTIDECEGFEVLRWASVNWSLVYGCNDLWQVKDSRQCAVWGLPSDEGECILLESAIAHEVAKRLVSDMFAK